MGWKKTADVSEERAASISRTEENYVPLKHEWISTKQYGVTSYKSVIFIIK